jgi:predicted homoserine dehydrogenase-like protein
MLISLISWAETLGLEIICAGKSSESDFIYDVAANTIRNRRQSVALKGERVWDLWDMSAEQTESVIAQRAEILSTLPQVAVPDLCEMSIVINATNYGYDTPRFRAPIVRIPEMAEVLGHHKAGGIFQSEGVIDMVNCLRRSDEAGFVGGVFVAVACQNNDTWDLLARKGHIINREKSRAVIFQPYHLLGCKRLLLFWRRGV